MKPMDSTTSQTEPSRFEESLQRQINKQADELAILRIRLQDLMDENARLRIERRLLQEEISRNNRV